MLLHVLRNAITELRLSSLVSRYFERGVGVLFGLTSVAFEADLGYHNASCKSGVRRNSAGG